MQVLVATHPPIFGRCPAIIVTAAEDKRIAAMRLVGLAEDVDTSKTLTLNYFFCFFTFLFFLFFLFFYFLSQQR